MKKRFPFLLFFLLPFSLFAQDTTTLTYARVYVDKAWKIINPQGKLILNQGYGVDIENQLCFSEGLAVSRQDDKFGFTDFSGKQVIPSQYDAALCFHFGLAPVAVGDKWGIIDRNNRFVVEPVYQFVGGFTDEGLAGVMQDFKLGFVDTTGKLVIPFKYYWQASQHMQPMYPLFVEGLIAVVEAESVDQIRQGKIGFMNTKGEMVIPPKYDIVTELPFFHEGKTIVYSGTEQIIIDTLGKELFRFPTAKGRILFFQDGFASLFSPKGTQGIINERGETVLKPTFGFVHPFSDGLARVQVSFESNTVLYINKKGEIVFGKQFEAGTDFYGGSAAVQSDGKWGYMDTSGHFILEPQWAEAHNFMDGLAVVAAQKGKTLKYGYINSKGSWVIEPIFDEAREFSQGLAVIKKGNKYGYIDQSGNIIIKPSFENASPFQRETIIR